MDLKPTGGHGGHNLPPSEKSENLLLSYLTEPEELAEQIRKAIANFDRSLAIQVWDVLKAKAKRELRAEVKSQLTAIENENFKLLVAAGFLQGMRVKYVGDPKYAEQYEGLELEVYSIDEYFQITCRKPNGAGYTTRLKPEELEIIS
jgi:CRISPR/Cas system-associated endonuclease/helicase Cas3